jgi:hypothetical protein
MVVVLSGALRRFQELSGRLKPCPFKTPMPRIFPETLKALRYPNQSFSAACNIAPDNLINSSVPRKPWMLARS